MDLNIYCKNCGEMIEPFVKNGKLIYKCSKCSSESQINIKKYKKNTNLVKN